MNFRRKTTCLAILCALLLTHSSRAETYVIDPAHSSVGFQVRHLFSKLPGRFAYFSGQIRWDETQPEQSSVDVSIRAASVDTPNEARDKDLRSDDVFHVEKFPEITFRSEPVKPTGPNRAEVTGKLTLHGVTKEVTLKAGLLEKGVGPQGTSSRAGTQPMRMSPYGRTAIWNRMVKQLSEWLSVE